MDDEAKIDLPAAAQGLVDFWADARGELTLPSKTAIDPIRLRGWIGDISIIELHDGPQRFWVRLHGSNLAAYIGTGFERRYLEDRIPAALHAIALKPYYAAIEHKLPTFSVIRPGLLTGVFDQLVRLILPFGGKDHDDIDRFLVWAGPSNRDRFECDTVYGRRAAAAASPVEDDAASLVVLQPDRPARNVQESIAS